MRKNIKISALHEASPEYDQYRLHKNEEKKQRQRMRQTVTEIREGDKRHQREKERRREGFRETET